MGLITFCLSLCWITLGVLNLKLELVRLKHTKLKLSNLKKKIPPEPLAYTDTSCPLALASQQEDVLASRSPRSISSFSLTRKLLLRTYLGLSMPPSPGRARQGASQSLGFIRGLWQLHILESIFSFSFFYLSPHLIYCWLSRSLKEFLEIWQQKMLLEYLTNQSFNWVKWSTDGIKWSQ